MLNFSDDFRMGSNQFIKSARTARPTGKSLRASPAVYASDRRPGTFPPKALFVEIAMEDQYVSLTKVEAAKHQLNAAIRMYLDHGDIVCAITLAGAAEEILGKLLEQTGRKHSTAEFAEACVKVGKHLFNEEWPTKHFVEMQTYFRNGLKHITDGTPITVPRAAADEIIGRAIDNLWALEGRETPEVRRYMESHGW